MSGTIDKSVIAQEIILQHEAMLKRPSMYFGADDDLELVRSFFAGYHAAAFAFFRIGEQFSIVEFYREAVTSRGWELRATSVAMEMKERGIPNKAIVLELINVELDAWRRFFAANLI